MAIHEIRSYSEYTTMSYFSKIHVILVHEASTASKEPSYMVELSNKYSQVSFSRFDWDAVPWLTTHFYVQRVPVILLVKNGDLVVKIDANATDLDFLENTILSILP